ncbi:MAG: ribosome biogenesis factor YjgA [Pseudomonadota bacterium]
MARGRKSLNRTSAAIEGGDASEDKPSKTALKREMTARQKLGEALVMLSERELEKMPIADERLHEVIQQARAISSHSAKRRHLQYLGKLMRDIDPAPLQAALDELHQRHRDAAEVFKGLEAWRDRLLDEGNAAIDVFLADYPHAERQKLSQLVRQHQREMAQARPPAAARKLFRYIREVIDTD